MDEKTEILVTNTVNTSLGRICVAGTQRCTAGIPVSNMRILGRYALVYLLSGGGYYADVRGIRRRVGPGDLLVLFPEIAHAYGPTAQSPKEDPWSEIYVVFEGPVFDLWRRQGLLDARRPVRRATPVEYWLRRMDSAVRGAQASPAASLAAVCRWQAVLAEIFTPPRVAGAAMPGDQAWLQRAIAALTGEASAALPVESIARQFNLSYVAFRKKFKRLSGFSPVKYRVKTVLDRACELLRDEGLAVKNAAHRLGFCDEFHFSRRFKQFVGLSPRQFRQQVSALRSAEAGGSDRKNRR